MSGTTLWRTVDTSLVSTAAGAVAVLCAATAFAGVFSDARWVLPALVSVVSVAVVGALGRRFLRRAVLVVPAQLAVLLVVLTTLFSGSAVLGVLPGPAAVDELGTLLVRAVDIVRTGVPPVAAEPALQCLVSLGLGLVAVVVDAIVLGFAAPAVSGLVLLCVFAVPASLDGALLPWWSFTLGVLGFALLLATGSQHRGWRRWEDRERVAHTLFGPTTTAVAASATAIALVVGVTATGVGTQGRLPGSGPDGLGGTDGIGLQPFTSLRGQLNRGRVVELFRVRGLPHGAYLRAMTLRKFDPQRGWQLDGLTQGVPADRPLPLPEGTTIGGGEPARVEIQPIGYRDPWLPVFGNPTEVSGMGPDWRYDPAAGIVFTQTNQESRPYTERLVLPSPSPHDLRNAHGPEAIAPAYLDTAGISPQVTALARRITAGARTDFDKAVALNRFFTDPANGFHYDLRTAPATGSDALSDFLFHGRRGFCEQFASSMAVMLRAAGIPSRVAIGFTAGSRDGDERVITTEDAHAWVEAYFPGWGWQTFDPTPLDDGRTSLPPFLGSELHPAQPAPQPTPGGTPTPPTVQPQPDHPSTDDHGGAVPSPAPGRGADSGGVGPWPTAVGLLAVLLALLASPAAVREARRRRRLHAVAEGDAGAASIAWLEVLDEFRDRGAAPAPTDTARMVADGLIDDHALDEPGAEALRSLVTAVEREWYAPTSPQADDTLANTLDEVRDSLARSAPLPWRDRLFPRSVFRLAPARA